MPIKIPDKLPAKRILESENIFVMTEQRALQQDIRPLKILIVNIMPTKIITETQLLRLLGNTPLQIEPDFLHMDSHTSKNTPEEHLSSFYKTFAEIKDNKYDGMIITGAPVENLEFEAVDYWEELTKIMDWSFHHVFSIFYICWGAQAGLYHHYGVPKYPLEKKLSGVFAHNPSKVKKHRKIIKGFDDVFYVPHSRNTEVRQEDILKVKELDILATSKEAGVFLVASKNGRQFFLTGHAEYDALTLDSEYKRDLNKGMSIDMPKHYYKDDNPKKAPVVNWRSHANLLFSNWLNYYVYQSTPYDLNNLK